MNNSSPKQDLKQISLIEKKSKLSYLKMFNTIKSKGLYNYTIMNNRIKFKLFRKTIILEIYQQVLVCLCTSFEENMTCYKLLQFF